MSKSQRIQFSARREPYFLAGLLLFVRLAQGQETASDDYDWIQHFRIGASVGLNIKANFKVQGPVSISNSRQPGVFDDGHVLVDDSGNAGGWTSNWGYNNQSQNTFGSDVLLMHRATSFSATGSKDASDSSFPGFDMAYGGDLWHGRRTQIGWEFGFGLVPINITANESLNGPVSGQIFTFATGNHFLPQAPFDGTSALSPETSIRTNYTVSTGAIGNGSIVGKQTLDVILCTFRLGPTLNWDVAENWSLVAGVGPAIGFASGRLKFDETITVEGIGTSQNKGEISGTDVVFGGYINATVLYHAVANGDLYLSAEYMPMGNASLTGAGHEATLKLGGQAYISAGVNWPF